MDYGYYMEGEGIGIDGAANNYIIAGGVHAGMEYLPYHVSHRRRWKRSPYCFCWYCIYCCNFICIEY